MLKKVVSLLITSVIFFSLFNINTFAEGFDYPDFQKKSESVIMIDDECGNVLFSENADERRPIAALTQIMTFIVAMEGFQNIESTQIKYSSNAHNMLLGTGASLAYLYVDEEFSVLDYLHLLLIPSGSDAAVQLCLSYDEEHGYKNVYKESDANGNDLRATYMPNSLFVKKMNETAKRIGCTDTNFVNPTGAYHEDQYSTARDMAIISRYARTLPYFQDIVNMRMYTTPGSFVYPSGRTVYTINSLFSEYLYEGKYYMSDATGMKTGSSKEAGNCMAASGSKDGKDYIVVALGSYNFDEQGNKSVENGAIADAKTLLNWGFNNFKNKTLVEEGALLSDTKIKYAWGVDRVQLVAGDNIVGLVPNNMSISSAEVKCDVPEEILAPVEKGQVLAKAEIYCNDNLIGTVDLVAKESIGRSEILLIWDTTVQILTSREFILTILTILIILIVYVILVARIKRQRKKQRMKQKMQAKKMQQKQKAQNKEE